MCKLSRITVSGTLLLALVTGSVAAQTVNIGGEVFRDPTQPPWATGDGNVNQNGPAGGVAAPGRITLSNFRLSFVRAGGSTPVAVINDQRLAVGDVIDGVRVTAIRPGEVTLTMGGDEQVLKSFTRPVRTAAEN